MRGALGLFLGCLNHTTQPLTIPLGVSSKKVPMLRSQDSLALESRARAIPLPKAKVAPKAAKGKGKGKGKEPDLPEAPAPSQRAKPKSAKPAKSSRA